ncbi:hypothetical protein FISHEDRAFT_55913 [Fistulina hepatica ATCC 64428]|uniref:Uncharacterized protein n=1 Tax=Fistulina hepatica ATCC 64428 TaxID=1128425 RepID=A0A0D7AKK8_9AGAR|nr:hypothetical protein FISHEDRAFT_55913 [Fistulina hepatica ATCC 64428]
MTVVDTDDAAAVTVDLTESTSVRSMPFGNHRKFCRTHDDYGFCRHDHVTAQRTAQRPAGRDADAERQQLEFRLFDFDDGVQLVNKVQLSNCDGAGLGSIHSSMDCSMDSQLTNPVPLERRSCGYGKSYGGPSPMSLVQYSFAQSLKSSISCLSRTSLFSAVQRLLSPFLWNAQDESRAPSDCDSDASSPTSECPSPHVPSPELSPHLDVFVLRRRVAALKDDLQYADFEMQQGSDDRATLRRICLRMMRHDKGEKAVAKDGKDGAMRVDAPISLARPSHLLKRKRHMDSVIDPRPFYGTPMLPATRPTRPLPRSQRVLSAMLAVASWHQVGRDCPRILHTGFWDVARLYQS